jgi:hypothetical protein
MLALRQKHLPHMDDSDYAVAMAMYLETEHWKRSQQCFENALNTALNNVFS